MKNFRLFKISTLLYAVSIFLLFFIPKSFADTTLAGAWGAIDDINLDGEKEIISADYDTFSYGWCLGNSKITLMNYNGKTLWTYDPIGELISPVAIGDISGNSDKEIVFISLAYIDPNTGKEIGNCDGLYSEIEPTFYIYVLNCNGKVLSGWPLGLQKGPLYNPVLADLDNDRKLDILVTNCLLDKDDSQKGTYSVYAFRGNGKLIPGYPFTVSEDNKFELGPLALDVTLGNYDSNSPSLEICFVTNCLGFSTLYALGKNSDGIVDILNNFTVTIDGHFCKPVAADINNDGEDEIITGYATEDGFMIHAFKTTGIEATGFPVKVSPSKMDCENYYKIGSFTIGDLDQDNILEIIAILRFSGDPYSIYSKYCYAILILNSNGTIKKLIPLSDVDCNVLNTEPLIADVDNNGYQEIIYKNIAYSLDGSKKPICNNCATSWINAITDLDGNGKPEAIKLLEDNKFNVYQLPEASGNLSKGFIKWRADWPTIRNNNQKTGRYISSKKSNHSPEIKSIYKSDPYPVVGKLFRLKVTAYDVDFNNILTYSVYPLPKESYFDSSKHILYWKPTKNQIGSYMFKIVVNDNYGGAAIKNISLEVKAY